jgi:hypothetical protein
MPLHWYLTLLLVAGSCGLVDQLVRGRFSRRGFLLATVVATLGCLLGWAMGYGLQLPELVPLSVKGEPFPLFWSLLGSATFLASLDVIGRRSRRRVAA